MNKFPKVSPCKVVITRHTSARSLLDQRNQRRHKWVVFHVYTSDLQMVASTTETSTLTTRTSQTAASTVIAPEAASADTRARSANPASDAQQEKKRCKKGDELPLSNPTQILEGVSQITLLTVGVWCVERQPISQNSVKQSLQMDQHAILH